MFIQAFGSRLSGSGYFLYGYKNKANFDFQKPIHTKGEAIMQSAE